MEDLKLFQVSILDDADWETELRVGTSAKEVEDKIWKEDKGEDWRYSCLMMVKAHEITEVDGYKIVLEK